MCDLRSIRVSREVPGRLIRNGLIAAMILANADLVRAPSFVYAESPPARLPFGEKGLGGAHFSPERIAYSQALKAHVKSKWRWAGEERLRAKVRMKLLASGEVVDVRIEESSGNSTFDESVVSAVNKASPAPPPPTGLYEDFKDIRFTFDSSE